MENNNPLIRPYLKWAGGKRQLLPEIKKYIPEKSDISVYYEPFVGAGAVFLALQPNAAVINDFNSQLALTYKVIKENIDELIGLLKTHKENNSETYYYEIRNMDRDKKKFESLSSTEKAARLIFLNKTCYNGLYRVNSQGLFNVPCGRYKNPSIYDEEVLRAVSKYLNEANIQILNSSFAEAVKTAGERDFVYFDPPYHSPDKTNFTGYQASGFSAAEQIQLRDLYLELTSRKVKCLLSNSDTEFIRDLYSGKNLEVLTVQANRAINSKASGRGQVNEVLIKNWRN